MYPPFLLHESPDRRDAYPTGGFSFFTVPASFLEVSIGRSAAACQMENLDGKSRMQISECRLQIGENGYG
jgi:hypothetical protein